MTFRTGVSPAVQLQAVLSTMRSQAVRPGSQNTPGLHRLTRELSELSELGGSSASQQDSKTGEAMMLEDPTSVVALLNVAGRPCICCDP